MPPAPTPPGVQPMRMPQRVVAPPNSTDMASRLASAAAKGVAAAKGDASLRALLTRNGLASYAPVFENEEVDMGSFILFDGADLEDIGITDVEFIERSGVAEMSLTTWEEENAPY